MVHTVQRYMGIDASLTATGLAMARPCGAGFDVTMQTVYTDPSMTIEKRLARIAGWVRGFANDEPVTAVGMEGFSFGDQFRQRDLGMVQGVIRLMVYTRYRIPVVDVSPRAAKVLACPDWHGLNKVNWERSGRTTKFKQSMPGKDDVGNGLFKRFGVNANNEHQADAACVALCLATGAVK